MTEEFVKGETPSKPLSSDIIELYKSVLVQDINDAITILFHSFLLETGFIPKDIPNGEKFKLMPEKWKEKGIFKIKYSHYCCASFTCIMTCVPFYNTVSVHGSVCDLECAESVDLKLNIKKYLIQKSEFSDIFKVFCNLDELSNHFKDNFCLPFLNLLHENVGKGRLYGMHGLVDELKIYMLEYLPVESVVSMSAVNKNFHELASSPLLWKSLYKRDFSKGSLSDIDSSTSEINWMQMYKKEYLKKKRKPKGRIYMLPRYRLPEFFSMEPDYDFEVGIRFDPPFPELYPGFMHPRLPFFRRLL